MTTKAPVAASPLHLSLAEFHLGHKLYETYEVQEAQVHPVELPPIPLLRCLPFRQVREVLARALLQEMEV